jgi:hypothetical protein
VDRPSLRPRQLSIVAWWQFCTQCVCGPYNGMTLSGGTCEPLDVGTVVWFVHEHIKANESHCKQDGKSLSLRCTAPRIKARDARPREPHAKIEDWAGSLAKMHPCPSLVFTQPS